MRQRILGGKLAGLARGGLIVCKIEKFVPLIIGRDLFDVLEPLDCFPIEIYLLSRIIKASKTQKLRNTAIPE